MLKFISVFLALAAYANADDASACIAPFQQFIFCMKQEARYYPKILEEEISPKFRKEVDKCLQKYNCNVPQNLPIDHNLTSTELPIWNKFRSWWDPISLAQKHCIIDKLHLNFRPKLTKCISKLLPGFKVPPLKDDQTLTPESLGILKKTAEFRLQVERATRKCPKHESDVDACVYELRRKGFDDTCKVRQDCNLDNSLGCNVICYTMSAQCNDFLRKNKPIACKCATDGQRENRKILLDIENKSGNTLHALVFTEPGNKITEDIQSCGAGIPQQESNRANEKDLTKRLRLRVTEYMDAFGDRDVTFCHECPDQEI